MTAPEIPGFENLVEIGRGGFAVVYRATQPALDRDVAIKVLTETELDDVAHDRFVREARAMGSLSWHPHIVVIHDTGMAADGRLYLSMEFLPGGSLADRIEQRGRFEWIDAARYGVQLAGALQTSHRHGLIHRDIKPENCLVDRYGFAKLTDFGIARVTSGTTRAKTGPVLGTIVHMPPEVIDGAQAEEAADVYSLGSTLFTLVHGSPAFSRESDSSIGAVLRRVTDDPIPDLRLEGAPPAFAELLEATMAKRPEERPPSARAVGERLQELQREAGYGTTELRLPPDEDSEPVVATPRGPGPTTVQSDKALPPPTPPTEPPVEPRQPPVEPARRRWLVPALVLLGVLVAAGIALVLLGGGDDGDGDGDGDAAPREETDQTSATTPQAEPTVAGTVSVDGPGKIVALGENAWVTRPQAGEVVQLVRSEEGPHVATTIQTGGSPGDVAALDDTLWVTDADGAVLRIDQNSRQISSIPVNGTPAAIAVTPDGAWAVDDVTSAVYRIEPDGQGVAATMDGGAEFSGIAATEEAVWASSTSGVLVRIDPDTDEVVATIDVEGTLDGVAATADAVWVVDSTNGTLLRIDPDTDEVTTTIDVGGSPDEVAVGDEGVWVATREGEVIRVAPESQEVTARVEVDGPADGIDVGSGAVWVTLPQDDQAVRLDAG